MSVSSEAAHVRLIRPLPVSPTADLTYLSCHGSNLVGKCGDFEGLISYPKHMILSKEQYHRGHMPIYTRGFVVLSAQDSSICFQLAEADVTLALKARTTANTQPLAAPIWPADVLWISCDM